MNKKIYALIFIFLFLFVCKADSVTLSLDIKQNTFEFEYSSTYETEAAGLVAKLPAIIESISNFYGDRFKLKKKVVIRIKDGVDKPAGMNYPLPSSRENIIIYTKAFSKGFNSAAILAHEISHSVILNNYSGFIGLYNPVPIWLDEGIACQFNMKSNLWTADNLKRILREYPELPKDAAFLYEKSVFEKYSRVDDYASRKIYCISSGIVGLIMGKIGAKSFFTFLDEAAKSKDMHKLLQKYTGETGDNLYREYLRSLGLGRVVLGK